MISGHAMTLQSDLTKHVETKKSSSKFMILINLISTKLFELVRNAALISNILQVFGQNTFWKKCNISKPILVFFFLFLG